jgi:DNA-binding GntR family transcriptional regulator
LPDLVALTGALDDCAEEMERAVDTGGALSDVDDQWHEILLSRCANVHLLRLIAQTKPLLKRYEAGYFGDADRARQSIDEHRRIAAALSDGNLAEATRRLVQNWVRACHHLGGRRTGAHR